MLTNARGTSELLIDQRLKSVMGSREDNMDGYMALARMSLVG